MYVEDEPGVPYQRLREELAGGDGRLRANRPSQPRDPDGHDRGGHARIGAARCCAIETPSLQGKLCTIETVLSAARAHDLRRRLPGLTKGEGALESSFAGSEPVSGDQPTRRRTTANPLNFDEYMMHLARRVIRPANERGET